jgi:hypothetical protein
LALLLFDEHLALKQQRLNVVWSYRESSIDHLETILDILPFLEIDLRQFDLDVQVIHQQLVCFLEVQKAKVDVFSASDECPSQSELNVANHIRIWLISEVSGIQIECLLEVLSRFIKHLFKIIKLTLQQRHRVDLVWLNIFIHFV